ncbi:hypothetical protein K458DRAFT_425379 [Lentithecium fluviatile CBS 122367]|uniref:Uncharacterized protein n=1 Tax=Lentithecium fluviatile CBS 122367 TaxID=1168545 RepID=A0A6G1JLE9_9PLEO|nr:hypothetical protein K458DRAFT_425379 [Lentithecium fluviatile CBS 122367]
MRFTILATATAFCSGTLSAPIESGERGWDVFITTEPNWGDYKWGKLQWAPILGYGVCVDLKYTPFDKAISSFGPGKSIKCIVYDDYGCNGNNEPIFYSGYADMGWNGWDNRVSSYRCGYCTVGVDDGCRDHIG